MHCINSQTLGETWVNLVRQTVDLGSRLGEEGYELLQVQVTFPASDGADPILVQFADPAMIREMRKVFFSPEANALGHSYAARMRGPGGRNDLQDVIALLRDEPLSKRAVLTLCGEGNGKVPCINAIQFLVRGGCVQTIYFARGQDVYKKFCADALCIAEMTRRVAAGLQLPAGNVSGFLASSHIYDRDLPAIRQMLKGSQCEHLAARGA